MGESICKVFVSDKELISRLCWEPLKLVNKTLKDPIMKCKSQLSKDTQMANDYIKRYSIFLIFKLGILN
jgi:hypothetical protein